jgi:undecaprenyl-diphosphatase
MRHLLGVFEWLGGHGAMVLTAVLVVVMCTWGFIGLTDGVRTGSTRAFDEWFIRSLDQHRGPVWMETVGRDLTALGSVPVLLIVTLVVAGYLFIRQQYGAMALMLIATLGGLCIASLLQFWIHRARPLLVPYHDSVYTPSFPSGHSMLSAVVYLTLGSMLAHVERERLAKWYFLVVALVVTFVVGVSRLYMGVHWPTDVLAGWAAGLVWALLLWLITRYLQARGAVELDVNGTDTAAQGEDTSEQKAGRSTGTPT